MQLRCVAAADAELEDAMELILSTAANWQDRAAISRAGPVYLVAWNDSRRGPRGTLPSDLVAARARTHDGTVLDQQGIVVSEGVEESRPRAPSIASDGTDFLIAWNINLASPDVELARRIARRIRESGGGLPRVQANGFMLEDLGMAQVSMNLLDFAVTPIWLAWETVRDVTAEDGIELAESELIGLAPLAALLDVADRAGAPTNGSVEERLAAAARYLKLRDFSPLQALELRLAAATAEDARR